MKYPSLKQFVQSNFDFSADDESLDKSFEIISSCIDMIFNEDDAWSASDCTKKELFELVGWFELKAQFKSIEKFFETMPKLSHTIKITNPKTKVESEVTLEGLQSFFA